jgi:hypothetical protein
LQRVSVRIVGGEAEAMTPAALLRILALAWAAMLLGVG